MMLVPGLVPLSFTQWLTIVIYIPRIHIQREVLPDGDQNWAMQSYAGVVTLSARARRATKEQRMLLDSLKLALGHKVTATAPPKNHPGIQRRL